MSDEPRPPSASDEGFLSLDVVSDKATIGVADDSELGQLREMGRALVNYLFMSLRTLAIHSSDNAAVDEPLGRLHEILAALNVAIHRTHFITVEGQVYLNDLRIKMEASAYGNINYLVNILDRHGIGGITFNAPSSVADLKSLLLLLLNTRPPPKTEDAADPLENIREALEKADIPDVDFDRPYYFKSGESETLSTAVGEAAVEQEVAALAYTKGVLAVKDYFRAVEAAETANPLRIRKIVHDLVDVAEEDPEDFLKLHTIHGIEDPYYNHCVNVSSLAVALGRVLKLSRVELAELGAAAMFHDLGYAAAEREAEEAGSSLEEWDPDRRMRYHPIAGFKTLLRQGEYGPGLMRRLLVTLEHHMHYRRPGGYPNLGRKRLSVYTRIIAVADHYDALVTPVDEKPGLLPARALEMIMAASDVVFDPVVVKSLVNVVGRYPYGSLVRLNTNEIGVVTSGGRTAEAFARPRLMVVRNADGTECPPREIDLAEGGVLRRRIAEVLDPFGEGITPHAVLFNQLGEQEEEAEGDAKVDTEAWNRAIWEGESTSDLLAEHAGEEDLGKWDLPALVDDDEPGRGAQDPPRRSPFAEPSRPVDDPPFADDSPFVDELAFADAVPGSASEPQEAGPAPWKPLPEAPAGARPDDDTPPSFPSLDDDALGSTARVATTEPAEERPRYSPFVDPWGFGSGGSIDGDSSELPAPLIAPEERPSEPSSGPWSGPEPVAPPEAPPEPPTPAPLAPEPTAAKDDASPFAADFDTVSVEPIAEPLEPELPAEEPASVAEAAVSPDARSQPAPPDDDPFVLPASRPAPEPEEDPWGAVTDEDPWGLGQGAPAREPWEGETAGREPEPWEASAPAASEPASDPSTPLLAETADVPSLDSWDDEEEREPEPWEVAEERAEPSPSPGPAPGAEPEPADRSRPPPSQEEDRPPPTNLTPEQVAAKKAAWRKALAEAWAKGGEAGVRALASRTWYDFEPDE